MSIEIVALSSDTGAEIRGVDLSRPLDPAVAAALRTAWLDRVVLVFRGQALDDDALRRSADWLGEAADISMPVDRRGDDDASIALISNIRDETGAPIGALGDGDMWFHHDNSFTRAPDKATWLYAVELPASGGNTLFGNCYRAYEALPERLRRSLRPAPSATSSTARTPGGGSGRIVGDAGAIGEPDARALARSMLVAFRDTGEPDPVDPRETPFETVAEEVFARYGRRWKPRTQAVNRVYLRRQIMPFFQGRPIGSITREDVQTWFRSLHAMPAAANRAAPVLSVIMQQAEAWGYRP